MVMESDLLMCPLVYNKCFANDTAAPLARVPEVFKYTFDTPVFKGEVEVPLGLYINGKCVDGASGSYIE